MGEHELEQRCSLPKQKNSSPIASEAAGLVFLRRSVLFPVGCTVE